MLESKKLLTQGDVTTYNMTVSVASDITSLEQAISSKHTYLQSVISLTPDILVAVFLSYKLRRP